MIGVENPRVTQADELCAIEVQAAINAGGSGAYQVARHREATKAREAALVSLLTDAREQINDASAAVPNDEWRHEMQALVERIDALTKEPDA